MVGKILKTSLFKDKVMSIEFKNTKKSNALSISMLDDLNKLLLNKKKISNYSCIIFKGYKEGPFSSGADLFALNQDKEKNIVKYQKKLQMVLKTLGSINVPKISLINSYCYGAGLIFALHTDVTIANLNAEFCIPAVKLGIKLPKEQIRQMYAKNINTFFLSDILVSGRKFGAEEAQKAKMLSMVIKENEFKTKCNMYINNLLKNKPYYMSYYLKILCNMYKIRSFN